MGKTVFEVLIKNFEDDIESSVDFLAQGGAKDFTEYKETVGRIRGLRLAVQTTQDLWRSQMEKDDE